MGGTTVNTTKKVWKISIKWLEMQDAYIPAKSDMNKKLISGASVNSTRKNTVLVSRFSRCKIVQCIQYYAFCVLLKWQAIHAHTHTHTNTHSEEQRKNVLKTAIIIKHWNINIMERVWKNRGEGKQKSIRIHAPFSLYPLQMNVSLVLHTMPETNTRTHAEKEKKLNRSETIFINHLSD